MLWLLLLLHIPTVLSEAPPSAPQDVHVDQWQLTWSPAPGETDVKFSVLYHSFEGPADEGDWKVVPACNQTPLHFCNVSFTKARAEHDCVRLYVQAQRHGLTSEPGHACSVHGDSCTPTVRLTARPGSLTVHLTQDHSLFHEHAAHATHRIYYGKEGEPLLNHINSDSSWTMDNLEAGQRYCAKVEYVIFNKSVGLSSCVQCEQIPEHDSTHSVTVATAVVVAVLLLVIIPVTAYVLIFQRERIKQLLRPPCEIPPDLLAMWPELDSPVCDPPPVEPCEVATLMPAEGPQQ
ncbi:interferon gamma receptor 2 [Salarias fasciatus]|uniref:Uncharacterized LOC115403663 n=1 Tax=Salarias fasciatus TaxID=181472 RepID=A0A672HWU1_SALFA|nr:uncharacterized protein LOC115403663 [Salarias fasciatus]